MNSDNEDTLCGQIVNKVFRVINKIDRGSFGSIYLAVDITTGKSVALKTEHVNAKYKQLAHEAKVYKILSGGVGIASIKWFGCQGDYNFLAMDYLGPSLEALYEYCSGRFTLKTVLMIADQLITRVQFVHEKGLLHRDIKPANFLVGQVHNYRRIYLIDFGLSKSYLEKDGVTHIPYREGRPLAGTARFASVNQLLCREHSRRDDLIALGYVLMYFNRGSLPWQGIQASSRQQKFERICEKKMNTPVESLCRNYPAEFTMFLHYCLNLEFAEVPDYDYLRQLFCILLRLCNHKMDYNFDWHVIRKRATATASTDPAVLT